MRIFSRCDFFCRRSFGMQKIMVLDATARKCPPRRSKRSGVEPHPQTPCSPHPAGPTHSLCQRTRRGTTGDPVPVPRGVGAVPRGGTGQILHFRESPIFAERNEFTIRTTESAQGPKKGIVDFFAIFPSAQPNPWGWGPELILLWGLICFRAEPLHLVRPMEDACVMKAVGLGRWTRNGRARTVVGARLVPRERVRRRVGKRSRPPPAESWGRCSIQSIVVWA